LNKFIKNILICTVILIVSLAVSMTFVFPQKYDEILIRECNKNGVSIELVRAVIWTESKYNPKAVSNAGAVGLMQLMPKTAYYIAELKGKKIEYADLKKADVSIELGVFYLKLLLDKFKDEKIAICAYNAGEGNVSKWIQTGESIPYKETREYVKRVKFAKKVYVFRATLNRFFDKS